MTKTGFGEWPQFIVLAALLTSLACRHSEPQRKTGPPPKAYAPSSPGEASAGRRRGRYTTSAVLPKPGPEDYIQRYLVKAMHIPASLRTFCAYGTYGSDWAKDTLHVYVWAFLADYGMRGDTVVLGAGGFEPVALKAVRDGDSMRVVSHAVPRDGELMNPDVHRLFPREYWTSIGDASWNDSLEKAAAAQAREFYRTEH